MAWGAGTSRTTACCGHWPPTQTSRSTFSLTDVTVIGPVSPLNEGATATIETRARVSSTTVSVALPTAISKLGVGVEHAAPARHTANTEKSDLHSLRRAG